MASLERSKTIRLRYKISAYCAAWILAFFATDPTLGLWSLVYMFPLGLFVFLPPGHRPDSGWTVLAAGWLIYLAHGFFYFRSRERRSAIVLLLLLVALLMCNVSGCRVMIHAH
jgi:hypothetical protein